MQLTASNLEFKLNVNLRLVKPDFMQSTAVNLEFKLKVIFKLLSCNRPFLFIWTALNMNVNLTSFMIQSGRQPSLNSEYKPNSHSMT